MDEYDSSRYAKVEDEGGEDIKEQLKDAKSSEMKSGAGRSASVPGQVYGCRDGALIEGH